MATGYECENLRTERFEEIEFSSERKMMSVGCKSEEGGVVYSKGAVDKILPLCTKVSHNGEVRECLKFSYHELRISMFTPFLKWHNMIFNITKFACDSDLHVGKPRKSVRPSIIQTVLFIG